MNRRKLFVIAVAALLIFFCFISQTTVFASTAQTDEQTDSYLDPEATDDEMIMNEEVPAEEETVIYYQDSEEQDSDEDVYIESDPSHEMDQEAGYEEDEAEPVEE